jgi:hypothetical protein
MKGSRRATFGILLAAFAVLSAWWAVETPRAPDVLLRAVPASATMVSVHEGLAGRWAYLSANPLGASLFGAMGFEPEELAAAGSDPAARRWLDLLGSDRVVFAYVPTMGPDGRGAWVFASWLGGRSQRLRWMLQWGRVPGFRRAGVVHGWPVWAFRGARASDPDLVVALAEGVLVGCLSPRPQDAERVLNCLDGLLPSLAQRPGAAGLLGAPDPDRGWFDFLPSGSPFGRPVRLGFAVSRIETSGIAGRIDLPEGWLAADDRASRAAGSRPEKVLGNRALAGISVGVAEARAWLASWTNTVPGWTAHRLLEGREGDLCLRVYGGAYSGRFRGIKLPTLVAAVEAPDAAAAVRDVAVRLDELNARHRWGLVPRALPAGFREVYAIEGTSTNLYAGLDVVEAVSFTAADGWLLVASNLAGFTNLLADAASGVGAATPADGSAAGAGDGPAGWISLGEGGKALRLAITAWSLKLMMTDPDGSRALRDRLSEVKAWIDTMAPLERVGFGLRRGARGMELHFEAGGRPAGGS